MRKDMTIGNPMKIILLFSLPVLLGNLFQQFYNMVDTVIVGQYLGEDALAAVGSTGCLPILYTLESYVMPESPPGSSTK